MTQPGPTPVPIGREERQVELGLGLDTFAFDLSLRVLQCLCDQLALTAGGPVGRCSLYSGEEIAAMDDCCNGQAAVRVYRIFPVTSRFPQQDFEPRLHTCDRLNYGVTLELTVYRCAATINERAEAPTPAMLTEEVRIQLDDAAAMRRAVRCCASPQLEGLTGFTLPYTQSGEYQEDDYNPIGPAGDCVGGRQRFIFQVYDVDCFCPPAPIDRSCPPPAAIPDCPPGQVPFRT